MTGMSVPERVADHVAGAPLSAFLATAVDGRPHVAPVWYHYDEQVYCFTGGQKLANLERNERVCLAIEGADWLAVLRGRATVREDPALRVAVAEALFDTYVDGEQYRDEDGDPQGALVEIEVGSSTLREY
jgi:nitroimidazol reductase NimA-like FMN-containing flavoprotein (pyridoxamine 5'-phosphate oxidase superfamily)